MSAWRPRAGYSMVELVVIIAMIGLMAVGLANLLQHPMNGYAAVSQRSELVALADLALRRFARDVRYALPNTVRVAGGGTVLELLHTTAGGRYRRDPGINDPGGPGETDHSAASDWISFGDDAQWNLLGRFQSLDFSYGTPLPAGTRVAIYPAGGGIWSEAATGANPGAITPGSTSITISDDGDEDQLQLSGTHRFSLESPNRRLYVVDTPVTYLCDAGGGSLWRIDGYSIAATQPTSRSAAPLAGGRIARAADLVESCRFDYAPGTPTRAALVTVEIVIAARDERVRLLQQIQVANAP